MKTEGSENQSTYAHGSKRLLNALPLFCSQMFFSLTGLFLEMEAFKENSHFE
jgi:hypothetical protein